METFIHLAAARIVIECQTALASRNKNRLPVEKLTDTWFAFWLFVFYANLSARRLDWLEFALIECVFVCVLRLTDSVSGRPFYPRLSPRSWTFWADVSAQFDGMEQERTRWFEVYSDKILFSQSEIVRVVKGTCVYKCLHGTGECISISTTEHYKLHVEARSHGYSRSCVAAGYESPIRY